MNYKIGNLFKGDKVIWMVLLFLCLISVPCRFFKLVTPALLVVSAIMLFWVLFFGEKTNDAGRWISLFGLKFQPSEIAKGTLVLVTAQILSAMQREDGADRRAFKFILVVVIPFIILIGLENLSTAALIMVVIFLMMFIGRVPFAQLGKMMAGGALFVVLFIGLIYMAGSLEANDETAETQTESVANGKTEKITKKGPLHRLATWKNRIDKKLNSKYVAPQDYDLDKDAQVAHANIAIVNSNIIGKGPGQSIERDFLPQAFSDFIFVIIIEELGIIGAGFVVLLYIVLLFRAARIASRCDNNFPAFLVLGLALMLVIQASFNMMVAVGIAPVTGQPLPLISRGGTSTIINCVYIGAILSVSRSAKKKGDKMSLNEI